jgi:hypothetical protein
MTDQPCRKDSRVVHDKEIAGVQVVAEVRERCVFDSTSMPREDHQSRLTPLLRRTLCDQLLRQLEIEIAGA